MKEVSATATNGSDDDDSDLLRTRGNHFWKMQNTTTMINKKLTRVRITLLSPAVLLLLVPAQLMATTAVGYFIAWGPSAGLCVWEMVTQPEVGPVDHVVPVVHPFTLCPRCTSCICIYAGDSLRVSGHCFTVLQDSHRLQSFHLLLYVQGIQEGH